MAKLNLIVPTAVPPRVAEYAYARGASQDEVIREINSMLAAGWQPYGPMMTDRRFDYMQPMVLYEGAAPVRPTPAPIEHKRGPGRPRKNPEVIP